MENSTEVQGTIKEIIQELSLTLEKIHKLSISIKSEDVESKEIILPKHFREILDVISTKDAWKKSEIITVFREVSLTRLSEQRLQRR